MVTDDAFHKAWYKKCNICDGEHLFFKQCDIPKEPRYIIKKFDLANQVIEAYDSLDQRLIKLHQFSILTINCR